MRLLPRKTRTAGLLSLPLFLMAAFFILISFRSPHSLVFSIIGTLVLVSVALCRIQSNSLGILAPFPIFLLGGALYTLPAALTLAASGTFLTPRDIPASDLVRAVPVSAAALLFAAGGYLSFLACASRSMRHLWHKPLWRRDGSAATIGSLLMAIGIAAAIHFVFNVAGYRALRTATYGGRYVLMDGHGLLIGFIPWISLGGLICFAHLLRREKLLAAGGALLLAGIALLWWTYLIGSRSLLIQFLIAGIIIRQVAWKPVSLKVLVALGTTLIAAAIFFEMSGRTFSLSAITSPQKNPLSLINPANSELGAPIQTLADILRFVPGIEPYQSGRTYFELPAVLVPKMIWPNRPQGAGNWYASRFYTSYWQAGGAYAFSPVAEAYLNFGPLGIAVAFIVIGIGLGALERKFFHDRGLSFWATIAYAVTVPYILMFFRLDAATLVKSLGVMTLGPLLVCAAGSSLFREMFRPAEYIAFKNGALAHPAIAARNQAGKLDTQP